MIDFELALRERGISRKTARRYTYICKSVLDKHGSLTPQVARTEILNQSEKNSPASANKYVLAFKAYCKLNNLDWGEDLFKIKETPIPKRQPSIELARDIIFIKPEISRDHKIHQKYSILFELMFLTGMRLCEVRALKVKNIFEEEIIIEKSKTGAGRRVATPPLEQVQKRLFNYLDNVNTEYAFASDLYPEKQISDRACRKEFAYRLERLGINYNYTPHTFRGAFMTRNLRSGAILFDVQDIVGHTSADTTKIYYRGDIESQRELMKHDPASIQNLKDEEKLQLVIEEIKSTLNKHNFSIEMKESKKEFTLKVCIDEN